MAKNHAVQTPGIPNTSQKIGKLFGTAIVKTRSISLFCGYGNSLPPHDTAPWISKAALPYPVWTLEYEASAEHTVPTWQFFLPDSVQKSERLSQGHIRRSKKSLGKKRKPCFPDSQKSDYDETAESPRR